MCPTHYNIKEKEEAYECLKEYPAIGRMNSFICDRKVYRDTISNGLGVIDSNNQKAKDEISKLVEEILNA
jgi:chromosome partitioning protein